MTQIEHRSIDAGGTRIHLAQCSPDAPPAGAADAPVVLMIHGFPESWYSWRNQLPALAEAGYRALVMDVRGYGRSSSPVRVEDYRMVRKVADVVALVDALGADDVTLVGHDWGAPIAWNSALLRPDRFRGVAGLSVPYAPPDRSVRPTDAMRARARRWQQDAEFYVEYFQQPGRAEAEIEEDVRSWLLGFYWCLSGDIRDGPNVARVERGTRMKDKFVHPEPMPDWMTEADLDVYTREFEYSGFFGPLARYRNVDRDWEDLAAFAGRPITIPSLFIGGERDGPTIWGRQAIERFGETLPALHGSHVLPGCGHWVQQERAVETNELLLDFLAGTTR